MSIATSRLPTPAGSGYQPEADLIYEQGRQGELFALSMSEGLKNGSVQVKKELRARDRVYIEYACQWSDGEWHDSGIRKPESAVVWFIDLGDCVGITASVVALQEIVDRIIQTGHKAGARAPHDWGLAEKPYGGGDRWATRGVVIPFRTLIEWLRRVSGAP